MAVVAVMTAHRLVASQSEPQWSRSRLSGDEQKVAERSGIRLNESSAPKSVVVFVDFECPACRSLYPAVVELAARSDAPQVIFRHFPPPGRRHAREAALAAECAHKAGRFPEMAVRIFALQDSLWMIDWNEAARQIGIADTSNFSRCRKSEATQARIAEDMTDARALGIVGTPFLVVGEQAVLGAISLDSLRQLVRSEPRVMPSGR